MDEQLKNLLIICLAAYAAVISTSVLIWDLYKWRYAERVRLNVEILPNWSLRGGDRPIIVVMVRVTNVGKLTTTINNIGFDYKNKGKNEHRALAVLDTGTQKLPFSLEAGKQWVGMVSRDDDFENFLRDNQPCDFQLFHTMTKKPIMIHFVDNTITSNF